MSLPAIGGKLRRASENVVAGVSSSVVQAPRNIEEFLKQATKMNPRFIMSELGQMGRVFSDASQLIKSRKADVNDVIPSFVGAVWRVMLQDQAKQDRVKPVAALEYHKDG